MDAVNITPADARQVLAKDVELTEEEFESMRDVLASAINQHAVCLAGECEDAGFWTVFRRGIRGNVFATDAKCHRRRMRQREAEFEGRVQKSGRPRGYVKMTLEDFKPRPGTDDGLAAIRQAIAGDRESLVLHGPVGSGKTHLAMALANVRLKTESVRMRKVSTLNDEFRAAQLDSTDALIRLRREFAEVELLVLDDLGADRVTAFAVEQLFVLLDDRLCRDEKQTVITTNCSRDALMQRLACEDDAGRLVSRLTLACWVPVTASDYRMQARPPVQIQSQWQRRAS